MPRALSPVSPVFRDRWTVPLLVLLTLLGGVLRFASLDRPSVWGDEAHVYGRVAGSYNDMLDQLATSSFAPLHYEVEWWIGQGMPLWGQLEPPTAEAVARDGPDAVGRFVPSCRIVPGGIRLTPFVLRLVPAVAGTLFVPAVFFLARQLLGPRVAITATFLASVSAYALVYSRDAKMYMPFWLAVTTHVACVLWWVRTRRMLAWAAWVAAGVLMVGLHGAGTLVLVLDVLIVLMSPPYYWRQVPRLAGLVLWTPAVIGALAFEAVGRWRRWQTSPWERWLAWPRRAWPRFVMPSVVALAVGVGVIVLAPVGPYGFYTAFSKKIADAMEQTGYAAPDDPRSAVRQQADAGELGLGWIPDYNAGRRLPDYLLYTTSAYLTGWEWVRSVPDHNDAARVNVRTLRLLQGGTLGLLALLAVGLVPWRRAFSAARARLDRIRQDRPPVRRWRYRRVLWLGVWLTLFPAATYTACTARPANPFDAAAAVVLAKPPDVVWPRMKPAKATTTAPSTQSVSERIADTRARAADAAARWPGAWDKYAAAFRRDNLNATGLWVAGTVAAIGLLLALLRPVRVGTGAVVLLGVGVLLLALWATLAFVPQTVDRDVWMPRYLGAIVPAVLILVAVLIDRQPAWLRPVTLTLFAAINLAQFGARVWGDADPPTALMAADVVAAQPKAVVATGPDVPTTRTYASFLPQYQSGEPAGGTLPTPAGRYYLQLLSGVPGDSMAVRFGGLEQNLRTWPFNDPASVERDVARSPQLERFVVWTGLPWDSADQTDVLAEKLKGRYRRVSEQTWHVRDHWRWYERFQVRRREYERLPGATTRPS